MIVGIDASNIRGGGGVTHLAEMLRAANPSAHGFSRVIVWSGKATLDQLGDRPWLEKQHEVALDGVLSRRSLWQRAQLSDRARAMNCSVLFVPGGSYVGDFRPVVTMSQNLLPFEWRELARYGLSWKTVKLILLRRIQGSTFRRADGVIFLTEHAREVVLRAIGQISGLATVVPHGIDSRFKRSPRPQAPITSFSVERPFRILYVSIIDMYKHQWHVADAVVRLRNSGLPVVLELVGPATPKALRRLNRTLRRLDPNGEVVRYSGGAQYETLQHLYAAADLCVFASSCETFGQIVSEAMAAGLPIACSNRSAMPEVLGDAGAYFDPENPSDIARALRELIESAELRAQSARASFERAGQFLWSKCADQTFSFLKTVAEARTGLHTVTV